MNLLDDKNIYISTFLNNINKNKELFKKSSENDVNWR